MPDAVSWLLIIICIVFSFFFSCSETAISCCNIYKMNVLADDGNKRAKLVINIHEKYDRALTVVLIGNNIAAVAISSISTIIFVKYFEGTSLSSQASLVSSIIMTFVVYILGDTLPKTIAKAIPDTISLAFVYPVYFFMILFFPITLLFEGMTKLFDKIFKTKKDVNISEEDFEQAVEKASDDETIEEKQAEIVHSALDFIDTKVKDVFTPRNKMMAIDIHGLTHSKLQHILLSTTYSRIPVYDHNFNNIIGVLHTYIYLEEYSKDPNVSIKSLLKEPYFVTKDVMIDDLFHGFRKHQTHIALIHDENNTVIGMVTMEDVLEELVSDISEPTNYKKKSESTL